jgi:ribosomal protein L25 (general stress protein Ctc)
MTGKIQQNFKNIPKNGKITIDIFSQKWENINIRAQEKPLQRAIP